jgi:hypothetical protein
MERVEKKRNLLSIEAETPNPTTLMLSIWPTIVG